MFLSRKCRLSKRKLEYLNCQWLRLWRMKVFKPCHLGDIPDNKLQEFQTQMDAVE